MSEKTKKLIHDTVLEVLAVENPPKSYFKATELRLYAYPILCENVKRYELDIEDLKKEGQSARSKDIVSWDGNRCGERLSPEDKQMVRILAVQKKLEQDMHEIEQIDACVDRLDEEEKSFVRDVFFRGFSFDEMNMPSATYGRRRSKIIRKAMVMLYGSIANF